MFIKEIIKKNKGYEKEFVSHRLVESYRAQKGPRQRTILNLGRLDLPKKQWKILADQIEVEISGQQNLYPVEGHIKGLARHYACLIIQRGLLRPQLNENEQKEVEYETIDLNSFVDTRSRTLGAEYVGVSIFGKLSLDSLFTQLGFSEQQILLATLSIVGRLVRPGSERRTRRWAQHLSAIDELLCTDFTYLSQNGLYRISDLLLSHKEHIERHLAQKERDLFSLEEKIILYDLTNTYFEGRALGNRKARRARSKDKRNDCPLLTLGLVIDEMGFPKFSKIFQGNISEPGTLTDVLKELQVDFSGQDGTTKKNITVVLDAGIATDNNLVLLKEQGYDYIVVARSNPVDRSEIEDDDLLTIRKDRTNKIEVKLIKSNGENILYCRSASKAQKEQSIKRLFQKRFEEDLKRVASSIAKKGGTKKYDKALKRIGRLQEKYALIAQYYEIDVRHKDGVATSIEWKFAKQQRAEERFSGSYFLRTSRTDLAEKQIWDLYIMLTNVEDAFRSLKSELNLRPIFHQKENRSDAHLFITVLAYHLLNAIQAQLKQHDIHMQWWNIRELLSSHVRITTSMTTKDGRRLHIRKSSEPEPFQRMIYDALQLNYYPSKMKKLEF